MASINQLPISFADIVILCRLNTQTARQPIGTVTEIIPLIYTPIVIPPEFSVGGTLVVTAALVTFLCLVLDVIDS